MQEASWVNDMLLFGVQVQSWVYQRNGPADAAIPVLAPDFVQRPVDVGPALGFLLFWEQRQLHNAVRRCQSAGLHRQAAHRLPAGMMPPEQLHGRFPDVQCVRCGMVEFGLPVIGQQAVSRIPRATVEQRQFCSRSLAPTLSHRAMRVIFTSSSLTKSRGAVVELPILFMGGTA